MQVLHTFSYWEKVPGGQRQQKLTVYLEGEVEKTKEVFNLIAGNLGLLPSSSEKEAKE